MAMGLVKLSNRSIHGVELSYEAIVNEIDGRRDAGTEWDYRLNLSGLPTPAHRHRWRTASSGLTR
jgi:hypothetical protein